MEQHSEYPHDETRERGMPAVRLRGDILSQFVPPKDYDGPVDVEKGETGAGGSFRLKSGAAQQIAQHFRGVVVAVADMFVEGGHGAAGDSDDEATARRQIALHVEQERQWLVQVFEDFGADGMRRPGVQVVWDGGRLEKVTLGESGGWDFAASHLNPRLAQFQTDNPGLRQPLDQVSRKVTLAATDVENSCSRAVSLNSEEGKDQPAPVFLRGVLRGGIGVLSPVFVPIVLVYGHGDSVGRGNHSRE